jgi:hypothetical protein
MALAWIEDNSSRSATIVRLGRKAVSSYSKSYKVFGTVDDTVVHAEANAYITGQLAYWTYPGQPNVQLRAESYSVSYLGDDAWQVSIAYEKQGAEDDDQRDPLKRSRSFDTSGGSQHITQAIDNVTVLTGGGGATTVTTAGERIFGPNNPPSFKGAIGVDGSSVNGVDIVVPALTWTETYDVPSQYVSAAYIRGVAGLTGSVNNASFRTFAAGEVLFMGCSGAQEWDDQRGNGPWTLSYKFVASPNVTAQKIGDITGIEKKGHEYLWVRYEDAVSSNELIKRPKAVYVNKVYRDGNFANLGIGT